MDWKTWDAYLEEYRQQHEAYLAKNWPPKHYLGLFCNPTTIAETKGSTRDNAK